MTAFQQKIKHITKIIISISIIALTILPIYAQEHNSLETTSQTITIKIKPGNNLYQLFKKNHISQKQLQAILKIGNQITPLAKLKTGQIITISLDDKHTLISLEHQITPYKKLIINKENGKYHAATATINPNINYTTIQGTIKHSLYQDSIKAGLPEKLVQPLVNIFNWQAPLAKSMHAGDTFKVTFEKINKNKTGHIIAAEIIQRKKQYQAIRYQNPNEKTAHYYTPDGKSLTPKFLRYPIKYTHISDKFNPKRRHPILHKIRPHWGVDFAAKSGTPIKATGDGTIIYLGRKGGFGRFIEIKHAQGYHTRYAHLSRYNKKLKKRSKVKRDQIIGYVGRSGLSTGSHLHYEFRINGQAKNPITVKLPQEHSIPSKQMQEFNKFKAQFWPIQAT